MLDRLRQGASGWVAKGLLAILMASFLFWGVSNQFRGYGSDTLAKVGSETVTVPAFDRTLRNRMEQMGQQTGRPLTQEQARMMGLPQQVLSQMVTQAALYGQARRMHIGISDDKLAQQIGSDPSFKGMDGQFDRTRFQLLLRNAGLRQVDYVQDMRENAVRRQLALGVAGGIQAPQPMVDALYRYQNEERTVSYVVVDGSAIEAVGEPDEKALADYFDKNKDQFQAPEYRKLGVLVLDPEKIAAAQTVTDADIAQAYQSRKDQFATPERRDIEQIGFKSAKDAQDAQAKLNAGTSFDDLAKSLNLSPDAIDLGLKTKAEVIDSVVADAAFAAQQGAVLPVLDGKLGPSIIRVKQVEASRVTPQEAVAPQLRTEIANQRARDAVSGIYDKVQDELAAGTTLQETASKLKVEYRAVDGVDSDGKAPDGKPVDLPAGPQVLSAAFQSEQGAENDPIRFGQGGFVFYSVLGITPARDRTLDEARARVVSAWKNHETENRIAAKANDLFGRLKDGTPLQTIATELGKSVSVAEHVKRNGSAGDLGSNAVAQAFAGTQGSVADAEADTPPNRILLQVDLITAPAFFAESGDAKMIQSRLDDMMQSDILQAYGSPFMQPGRVSINQEAFARVSGQNSGNSDTQF
ncbi:peptidyl-prolyl cis-trans isomerase D [Faunimonas pinastri]|uniref:Parvulin-like PPIase n=1 Tax=Faunimonas pinastri TaxID=1855383 RepID=A0A1H9NAF0_9HYPH|nr:SurA N-terminal domain-containing protein [Faunimonas pinastri]SER32373.1 peptidyl-prolyl cis-trans isomerase D [Faunimonas pinastri]